MQSPPSESNRLVIFAAACVLAAWGCGKSARDGGKGLTAGVAHASSGMNAHKSRAAGAWHWSHLSDKDGVRRVELERWQLRHTTGDQVSGHYDRQVTFMSLDGIPFRCSQSLRYRLTTRFKLRGTLSGGKLALKEVDYVVSSSPCDSGYRDLSSYGGKLAKDTLQLAWRGGTQTLTRATGAPLIQSTAARTSTTSGTWRWQNRRVVSAQAEVRVESEKWSLKETKTGTITGTYQRSVTVFTQNGRLYKCNGNTFYRYNDAYTVRGSRNGERVILSEIASKPEASPCLSYNKRHLDAATGKIHGDFLVLEWRGRHKQILHR